MTLACNVKPDLMKLVRPLGLLASFVPLIASADVNVALNKPVSLVGAFGALRPGSRFGTLPLAPAASLTDGVFLPEGRQWQTGTVWWDVNVAGGANDHIKIDLQGLFTVTSVNLQCDNNDRYRIWSINADESLNYLGYYESVARSGCGRAAWRASGPSCPRASSSTG